MHAEWSEGVIMDFINNGLLQAFLAPPTRANVKYVTPSSVVCWSMNNYGVRLIINHLKTSYILVHTKHTITVQYVLM